MLRAAAAVFPTQCLKGMPDALQVLYSHLDSVAVQSQQGAILSHLDSAALLRIACHDQNSPPQHSWTVDQRNKVSYHCKSRVSRNEMSQ